MTTLIPKQTESLHARIPQEILKELDIIAARIGRSRNWIFNEALKQYVEIQQWQTDLIKQRLSESVNPDIKLISHNKIMKRQEKRLKAKLGI